MKSPEEFEIQIDKAIEKMVAKGFVLKRFSYGNADCGCALTAGYLASDAYQSQFVLSNQIKRWGIDQIGFSETENFETGFDWWDFNRSRNNPFFLVGVRLGQKWKPV